MTTLTIRPSAGERKSRLSTVTEPHGFTSQLFADITDLVKLNNPTGQLDEDNLVCDLQQFFEAPEVDQTRDMRVWTDIRGKLIGFGQLLIAKYDDELEGYLYFDVHPTWHGTTLETEILQWSEARLRDVATEHFLPAKLRFRSREDNILRQLLLARQGFITERRFLTMACLLDRLFPSSSLPSDFSLRSLCDEQELQAWVELFNESFIDHWDHHDMAVETVRQWLKNPSYKPELNLVAVASDNTLAAFCVGYVNQEENARTGCNEGWIKLLGTRRGFRKLGLGRAILFSQMRQLQAMGVERVNLGVDAQNLTSATQLYQSIGFQPISTWLSYVKTISPHCLSSYQTAIG